MVLDYQRIEERFFLTFFGCFFRFLSMTFCQFFPSSGDFENFFCEGLFAKKQRVFCSESLFLTERYWVERHFEIVFEKDFCAIFEHTNCLLFSE